jgi:hypothetical protein
MHVIWARAYGTKGLLAWVLGQRLPGKPCDFSSAVQGPGKR